MMDGFQAVESPVLAQMVGRSVSAAQFLALFGVRVRNHDNVARINAILADVGVATIPSFSTCPTGSELHIIKAKSFPAAVEPDEDDLSSSAMPHRALQVGDLPSARNGLDSVSPGTDLAAATMLMRVKNYSQLPVIDGTSDLRGVLTWSSVALNLETGKRPTLARAMTTDSIPVAEVHQQLLAHLPAITKQGYLLVRANNGTFCGIITSADVSGRFETMARPFFLVGDIEARLRKCLAVLNEDAIAAVQRRKSGKITDLTFGEYKNLIDNDANWKLIGWPGVPRDQFIHRLDKVRIIRNEIAHFRPEPLAATSLAALEEFAGLLRQYVP
ncbi:CBS domain-containing protein [Kibdelosporangium philippinense]|uniref:CBS domain-containing protein n=1 Tax=Kibdelosporangium philippinense TaxID=211113 RepID=A0ABS8ZQI5_9PSEU|nr:CBS domain-containing protein [Kibdelosporangium philippinense]MCE7009980.1 CBS domain-containing protein [Kibdelosporangium philippinense]